MDRRFMGVAAVAAVCIALALFACTALATGQEQPIPAAGSKLEDLPDLAEQPVG